jgi:hypothetical protein
MRVCILVVLTERIAIQEERRIRPKSLRWMRSRFMPPFGRLKDCAWPARVMRQRRCCRRVGIADQRQRATRTCFSPAYLGYEALFHVKPRACSPNVCTLPNAPYAARPSEGG